MSGVGGKKRKKPNKQYKISKIKMKKKQSKWIKIKKKIKKKKSKGGKKRKKWKKKWKKKMHKKIKMNSVSKFLSLIWREPVGEWEN